MSDRKRKKTINAFIIISFNTMKYNRQLKKCIYLCTVLIILVVSSTNATNLKNDTIISPPSCPFQNCLRCILSPSGEGPGSCCNKTYTCYDDPIFGYPICLPPYRWICGPDNNNSNQTFQQKQHSTFFRSSKMIDRR